MRQSSLSSGSTPMLVSGQVDVEPDLASAQAASSRWAGVSIAVLLPCYNEETTIADVVDAFRRGLPEARIFVYDNGSSDATAARARAAGAFVLEEKKRGKGNVVRRMFADIDADVYVLSDGDLTYDISNVASLISELLRDRLDMLIGARQPDGDSVFRRGHALGNDFFNRAASLVFGSTFQDIFSGYRILSRRFVKSFPAVSKGFEIEMELAVHAIDLRVPVRELPVVYRSRPTGSQSKLRTMRDGLRIFGTLLLLFKEVRPLAFFLWWASLFALISITLGYPLIATFLETGLVPRLPTAVLATGLMMIACVSLACGLVLDSVGKSRHEVKRLYYLSIPPLSKANDP